jgi:Transposase IS66 family
MEQMNLSEKRLNILKQCQIKEVMNQQEVDAFLNELFPNPRKHQTNRRIILEASAIVAYQQLPHAISLLLTDDAPQFRQITDLLALCWIHDGRHYKKLEPVIPIHREQLKNFLDQYWIHYHQLNDYKQTPTASLAVSLSKEFDTLFSTKTGYDQLDKRIEKTKMKKDSLLLVLKYPDLPLHNNDSELGARTQARYRDISFHTINKKGTEAKDTFMTIVETAKKVAVNSYQYLRDRISKKFDMPSLASLIQAKGQVLV